MAEQLRQRIVELKIKIDRQLRLLDALKVQIKTQFISVQRLEVNHFKYTIKSLTFKILFIFPHNSELVIVLYDGGPVCWVSVLAAQKQCEQKKC